MTKTVYAVPRRLTRMSQPQECVQQTATECHEWLQDATVSNHRCCAERRLLDEWISEARRHGVSAHKTVSWIRRKIGGHIAVIRWRADGTLGCAVPCVLCQRELLKYDLHIHCTTETGDWFSGRLRDGGVPAPVLTAGQRRMFKRNTGAAKPANASS